MPPYIPDQQINTGNFVQQTPVFDVSRLYEVEVGSPEFKELIVRLAQQTNNISLVLNNKTSGYYLLEEFITGNNYFNPNSTDPLQLRPVFRKVINIGALNAGVNNRPHGLTIGATWTFTHIYGAVSNFATNNYFPLPFANVTFAGNIELRVDNVNVVINNASGQVFTAGYVILEYLKQ